MGGGCGSADSGGERGWGWGLRVAEVACCGAADRFTG